MDTTNHKMNFTPVKNPHTNLIIPDTWGNVREFADWWVSAGMPLVFPAHTEVHLSDDATSTCLFKKGRFQVELYLIHPLPRVPEHEHPDVEVIKMRMGLPGGSMNFSDVLHNGERHGSGLRLEAETRGFPLIAFQHWLTREPTTIASMWKGPTVGPKQDALIKKFTPDAFIKDGWADITKNINSLPNEF
jgi:hypothetical protein